MVVGPHIPAVGVQVVVHGRADVGVAEDGLDRVDRGSALQHVSGEAVAEEMGPYAGRDARSLRYHVNDLAGVLSLKLVPVASSDEQEIVGLARRRSPSTGETVSPPRRIPTGMISLPSGSGSDARRRASVAGS